MGDAVKPARDAVREAATSGIIPPGAGEPVRTLDRLAEHAATVAGVHAEGVRPGDWIVFRTRNSTYSLAAVGNGLFRVAGGWFAAEGQDNALVRITGCTWGGRAIHTGLVAAPGMFIEFSNGVCTTRVRDVRVIRGGGRRPH